MKFSITKVQFDWWLQNVGSPAAPLEWLKRLQSPSRLAGAGLAVATYLALILWAALFIWVWFTLFVLLFLYEGLGLVPWTRSSGTPAPPAESHR